VKGSLWREKSAGHGVERAEGARGSWGRCVSAATMPWPRRGRSREARDAGAEEAGWVRAGACVEVAVVESSVASLPCVRASVTAAARAACW
jgi:hypothetical protein